MKTVLFFLALFLCLSLPVGAQDVGQPAGSTRRLQGWAWDAKWSGAVCDNSTDDRSALNTAATAAAVLGGRLVIPGKCVVGSTLTIPANVSVIFENGGQLKPANGIVITFNGGIETGPVQIFGGAGTFTFTNNRKILNYYPEWWGADGSDTTDDSVSFQAALTALPGNSTLRIPSGANRYYIGTGLVLNNKQGVTIQNPAYAINFGGFYWTGSSGTVLEMRDCISATIDGLNISLGTGAVADNLILMTKVSGQSTANTIRNCYLNAGTTTHNNTNLRLISLNPAGATNGENIVIEGNTMACSDDYARYRSNAGAMTASGTMLTCADCAFVAGDVNKYVRVGLVGTGGATLLTTIASVPDSTHAVLTNAASATATGARVHIGRAIGTGVYNGPNANMKHQIIRNNRISQCHISVESEDGSVEIYNLGGGQATYGVYIHEAVGEPVIIEQIVQESNLTEVYNNSHANTVITIRGPRNSNTMQITDGFYMVTGHIVFEDSAVEALPPKGGRILRSLATGNLRISMRACRWGVNGRELTHAEMGLDTLNSGEKVFFDGATDGIQGLPLGPSVWSGSTENPSRFSFTTSAGHFLALFGTVTDPNWYGAGYGLHAVSGRNTTIIGDDEIELDALARPNPVQYRVYGTPGATLYAFSITACDAAGQCSLRSVPTTLTTANATLSSTDFIRLTWPAVPNASTYNLYQQNPANAQEAVLVASGISGTTYDITSNPSTSYAAWSTLVPAYNQASTVRFRSRIANPLEGTFADGDTTPSVKSLSNYKTANTGATSITTFDDGVDGQIVSIRVNDANTTFVNGSTLKTGTGSNLTGAQDAIYTFEKRGSVWYRKL